MAVPRLQAILDRVTLTIFAAASVSALALSQATRPAWIFAAACAVPLFLQIPRVHHQVVAWARFLVWSLLCAAFFLGLILMAYPILSAQTTTHLILFGGYSLAAFALLFLFGRTIWPAASALIPTALGILMVACFNPAASLRANLVTAGGALFAWLALPDPQQPSPVSRPTGKASRMALIAAFAFASFLTAWGIIRFLPWAQSKVEQATFQSYMAGTTHYSMFSPDSTLGDIARLKLSQKVVLRVWSSRPQKLRGRVFIDFNGLAWRSKSPSLVKARNLTPLRDALSDGNDLNAWLESIPGNIYVLPGHTTEEVAAKDSIRTKVLQASFNEGMVLMPGQTVLVRIRAASMGTEEEGGLPLLFSGSEIYGLINRREGAVIDPSVASPQIMKECLSVPMDTDARIRELAARLARGTATPEECIRRTLDYLGRECHYSLEVGTFHSRQPVAEFLFEKKRGYCQYFASAAAVLLRLEGVPCRYVTGFNVQEDNRQGDHYVVREMDAHAWIEAYAPGRGWLELDPTPEAGYLALHGNLGGGWWAATSEWLGALMAEISIRLGEMRWGSAWHDLWDMIHEVFRWMWLDNPIRSLLFLALLLLCAGLARQRRGVGSPRRAGAASLPPVAAIPAELRALANQVEELWADQGLARQASRAPLEHLRSIPPDKISPQMREVSGKIVDCFYRCCFGGLQISPAEIQGLGKEFEKARSQQYTAKR
jgi:transglutaminase-like putative cysteine protease